MSAHTPGPWAAVGDNSKLEFVEKDIGGSRMTIATCFQQGAMRDGERAANARLIAAAPDLLAALAGIIEIGKRDLTNPKYDAYFEEARAALRKARGGQ